MANERGKHLDKTHLSIDNAEARGFIHRDYLAHCLRWSHVIKFLQQGHRYKTAHILDVGCGKEVPLAKTMYSSKLNPVSGSYTGVDANQLTIPDVFHTGKFNICLISGEFPSAVDSDCDRRDSYDVITCFEVCEHVEPAQALEVLKGIRRYLAKDGTAFLSTPCYDAQTGAAANHVNEMSYQAFGSLIEHAGLGIRSKWGTFASIKDYVHLMPASLRSLFDCLREYYDTNYLATIFAPLFPEHSRNCLWEVFAWEKIYQRKFPQLNELTNPVNSSSTLWSEFAKTC